MAVLYPFPGPESWPESALQGAPLGTIGINFSTRSNPGLEATERLRRKFQLQATARRILPNDHAIAGCMRLPIPGRPFVEVWHVPPQADMEEASAIIKQVRTCRNAKACPVCASLISERRRQELHKLDGAARERGLAVLLVTLTARHKRTDDLAETLEALLRAVGRFWGGRNGQAFRSRFVIQGYVRGLEVTYGRYAGWHPHCHLLVYLPREVVDRQLPQLQAAFLARWLHVLRAVGLDGNEHACDVEDSDARIAEYLSKYGHAPAWDESAEVAKAWVKHGRGQHLTPWDLLSMADDGDQDAARLFAEWVRVSHRRRLIQASPGLADLIGRQDLASDDELADAHELRAWLLALIRSGEWRQVVRNDALPEVLAAGRTGRFAAVAEVCAAVGVSAGGVMPDPFAVPLGPPTAPGTIKLDCGLGADQ